MAQINMLNSSVEIKCPQCGAIFDMDDLEVSVTVQGYDDVKDPTKGVAAVTCKCKRKIRVTAQLNVEVG